MALVRPGHLGLQQQRDLADQQLRVALGLQPALGPRTCRRKDHGCKSVCLLSESAIINEVLVLEKGKIKQILFLLLFFDWAFSYLWIKKKYLSVFWGEFFFLALSMMLTTINIFVDLAKFAEFAEF